MIKSFRHQGLKELFVAGVSAKVMQNLERRCLRRLVILDNAATLENLKLPGMNFHPLRGKPQRYSIHVNGPWCITFEWDRGDAFRIDLEQYH